MDSLHLLLRCLSCEALLFYIEDIMMTEQAVGWHLLVWKRFRTGSFYLSLHLDIFLTVPICQENPITSSCFIRLMASKSGTSQINKYSQTIQIFIRQSGFKGWIMLPAFLVLEIRHYQYGSTNILHYQYGSTKTYLCLFRGKFSGSSNISFSFYFQFFNHVDRILKVRKQLSSCLLLSSTLTKTVLFFYESYHVTDNTVM